jgi:hypothetical protein
MPFCHNSVKWVYELEKNYAWDSGLPIREDQAFKDKKGVVRLILETGGRITVTQGYAWDGCTPKFCLFDILLGIPDGVVDSTIRRPKTYYASLVHDALYQFLPEGPSVTRAQMDHCFLKLMEATGFRPRMLYFVAVRLFGGLFRHVTRLVRKTHGTKLRLA